MFIGLVWSVRYSFWVIDIVYWLSWFLGYSDVFFLSYFSGFGRVYVLNGGWMLVKEMF